MSTALLDHQAQAGAGNGGVPARRAVIRWAWRMFRREWRQQTLVLALIVVALAATVVGAAVATNTPPPAGAGFGTAHDMATLPGGPHLTSQIAALQQDFGRVDVIENQTVAIPGSINTSTCAPRTRSARSASRCSHWSAGATRPARPGRRDRRRGRHLQPHGRQRVAPGRADPQVVGIVQNPQSLLDEFALVAPVRSARRPGHRPVQRAAA